MTKRASTVKTRSGSLELAENIVQACTDAKGKDIAVLKVAPIFDMADYFVIVSGRSDRQVQGIANKILEKLSKQGAKALEVEGYEQAHWVLIDVGDVIVHVFYEPLRAHYDIEGLWMKAERLTIDHLIQAPVKGREAA